MSVRRRSILYISGTLPARSETFVTREVLGLRSRGIDVRVASVHRPEADLGDDALDSLALEAIPVYSAGACRLLADVFVECVTHPIRALDTIMRGNLDALFGSDIPLLRKVKVLWQCLAGLALARRVRPLGVDHLHAHMAHVPTTIAMYAARQLGGTFSFTGHAVDLFRHRTLLREKLERAAFISCISEWHRAFYRGIAPLAERKCPIVRCGVDVSRFRPITRDGACAAVHIAAVGRLVEKKGFDLLIRAIALLRDEGRGVRCTIAGDGPQRGALEEMISSASLQSVINLPGALSNQAVRSLMQQADLFVLPCRVDETGDRDGIPVVLMEAMACGVSAVSGNLPAIRELIDDDRTGRLINSDDLEGLTAILRSLVHDHEARRRLGAAGRNRVIDEFSLEKNLDRIEAAFESVLGPLQRGETGVSHSGATRGANRIAATAQPDRDYTVGGARSA